MYATKSHRLTSAGFCLTRCDKITQLVVLDLGICQGCVKFLLIV